MKEFDIKAWVSNLSMSDLGKLTAMIANQGKSGHINKLLKPHMQFVAKFNALKE